MCVFVTVSATCDPSKDSADPNVFAKMSVPSIHVDEDDAVDDALERIKKDGAEQVFVFKVVDATWVYAWQFIGIWELYLNDGGETITEFSRRWADMLKSYMASRNICFTTKKEE